MRIYETTFIVNSQTDDGTIDRQVKDISGLITTNAGVILHEDRVGTRKLAYPINGLNHGYYTTITFEGTNDLLTALERHYHLSESYLRHLTVVYEGDRDKIGQSIDPFGFAPEGEQLDDRGRPPRRGGRFERSYERRDYDGRPPREHQGDSRRDNSGEGGAQ